jgi:hypothetical protein
MDAKHLLHCTAVASVSISILVFSLIPKLSANSNNATPYFKNKPKESSSMVNIQATGTNQPTLYRLIISGN